MEILQAEQRQRLGPAAAPAPFFTALQQQVETGQVEPTADAPAPPGQAPHAGMRTRFSPLGKSTAHSHSLGPSGAWLDIEVKGLMGSYSPLCRASYATMQHAWSATALVKMKPCILVHLHHHMSCCRHCNQYHALLGGTVGKILRALRGESRGSTCLLWNQKGSLSLRLQVQVSPGPPGLQASCKQM